MSTTSSIDELLQEEQEQNLEFLEGFGEALPGVKGVPLILGLTYEAIQFFNTIALSETDIVKGKQPTCDQ